MKRFGGMTLVMLLAAGIPAAALAAIIPVAQTRSVDAESSAIVSGDSDSDSGSLSAVGFGPFDATVDPLAVAIARTDVGIAQGIGKQTSSIGTNSISALGEASVSLTLLPQSGATAAAKAASFFDVLFTVDTLSSYLLAGSVDTLAIVTGGASLPLLGNDVILEDVDGALVLFATATNDEPFSVAGSLSPGSYRLRVSADITADQGSSVTNSLVVNGTSSYEVSLRLTPEVSVPLPASSFLVLIGLAAIAGLRYRGRPGLTAS